MHPQTRFIGTWHLVSQNTHYRDGRVVPSRGDHPAGILMYDVAGNMAVQLMRTDDHAGDFTDASQLATAMQGYHAYFGTYEVDEVAGVVVHQVVGSAYPPYRGSRQVRRFRFDGEYLTLTAQAPDDEAVRVLVWRRG